MSTAVRAKLNQPFLTEVSRTQNSFKQCTEEVNTEYSPTRSNTGEQDWGGRGFYFSGGAVPGKAACGGVALDELDCKKTIKTDRNKDFFLFIFTCPGMEY